MKNIEYINLLNSNLSIVPINQAFKDSTVEIMNILSKGCVEPTDIPAVLNRISNIKWNEVKAFPGLISVRAEDNRYLLRIHLK